MKCLTGIPQQKPRKLGCAPCRGSRAPNYPSHVTCGMTNPYYDNRDFYYSHLSKRNINKCQMEDYWSEWLEQSISANPYENLVDYYNAIVTYIQALYQRLVYLEKIQYGNLSTECSAIILIKRCLAKLFTEDEASKIIHLLKIQDSCECKG